MDLRLCGICFKMRGGPDLLDYVLTDSAVPMDIMTQVMAQMGSITEDELAFARQLDKDWKKAFNDEVPLLMGVMPDGGYDISCSIPDNLLRTVHTLTGLDDGKIVEEYVSNYLKNVCGIDTSIVSVDMESTDEVQVKTQAAQGFDLSDLGEDPDGPAFEDVSEFGDMDVAISEEPVAAAEPEIEEPAVEEPPIEDGIPVEEGYPDSEAFPEDGYPEEEEAYVDDIPEEYEEEPEAKDAGPEQAQDSGDAYADAVTTIYKELVGNIRDKKLDKRLGIKVGA